MTWFNIMADASDTLKDDLKFYETIKHFPPVINEKINFVGFLEAASDLLLIIDRLGKVFAPAKYDIQGNIEKIKKHYVYDENSCLLELIKKDSVEKSVIESVVWLNRAMLFIELTFQEWLLCLQANELGVSTKMLFTVAYEGSLKKHHNWVTQQIFTFICKMSPTIPQILKNFECDGDLKAFEACLNTYTIKLHLIRCKIDDFIKENGLFDD